MSTYTSYSTLSTTGELWLRDAAGLLNTSNKVLSAVYAKYQAVNSNFFSDLSSNSLTRFDVFYDTLFFETNTGCAFEKIYIDNGSIRPFNYRNNFTFKNSTPVDYWFNEKGSKIYISQLLVPHSLGIYLDFYLDLKEYNCLEGYTQNIGTFGIRIAFDNAQNWDIYNHVVEAPKMTYNEDSKRFNVSFIFRNAVSQSALVSINFKRVPEVEITEINSFIPFASFNANNSFTWTADPNTELYEMFAITDYDVLVTNTNDVVIF